MVSRPHWLDASRSGMLGTGHGVAARLGRTPGFDTTVLRARGGNATPSACVLLVIAIARIRERRHGDRRHQHGEHGAFDEGFDGHGVCLRQ